jgi:hypothetical protein
MVQADDKMNANNFALAGGGSSKRFSSITLYSSLMWNLDIQPVHS